MRKFSAAGIPFAIEMASLAIYDSTYAYIDSNCEMTSWYYKDLSGVPYGPYTSLQMYKWLEGNYFPLDLQICENTKTGLNKFKSLKEF